MEPRTLPQRFCEAKRAEEERTEHAEACPMRSETSETAKKRLQERLEALSKRFGRVWERS